MRIVPSWIGAVSLVCIAAVLSYAAFYAVNEYAAFLRKERSQRDAAAAEEADRRAKAEAYLVIDDSYRLLEVGVAAKVSKRVARDFFDPEAAQFTQLSYSGSTGGVHDKDVVCGFVNGKNRMGGYVGARPFLYRISTDELFLVPSSDDDSEAALVRFVSAMGCPPH